MTDIVSTAAKIAPIFPQKSMIFSYIASEVLSAGNPVYLTSAGKVAKTDAKDAVKAKFRGVALENVAAGQVVDVLTQGHVAGFDVSALDYDASLYLSDTAGALSSTSGSSTVNVGRVLPLTDNALTKVVYFDGAAG